MLKVTSFPDAINILKNNFKLLKWETELANLSLSYGRILAEDIIAPESIPSMRKSSVDGFAVIASDTYGANDSIPAFLKITGEVEMGQACLSKLKSGEAIYVPTGAMLPEQSNAVVMIENTQRLGNEVAINTAVRSNENVVNIGEDILKGNIAISKHTKLNSMHLGLLASLGIQSILVYKKLSFYIISTGDEIVEIDYKQKKPWQTRDSNRYILEGPIIKNHSLSGFSLCNDSLERLTKSIEKGLQNADIVIITGGSSVGAKDFARKAILEIGANILFDGIAIKPGKPTFAARLDKKLIYGLAGHPMAVGMAYKLFIEDVLDIYFGLKHLNLVKAKSSINFPSTPGRTTIVPLAIDILENQLIATPLFTKSSLTSDIANANGFTLIEDTIEGIYKNDLMDVYFLN